jgi:hypothetical protein
VPYPLGKITVLYRGKFLIMSSLPSEMMPEFLKACAFPK